MDCNDWQEILGFESLIVAIATSRFDNFRRLLEVWDLVKENSQASKLLIFASYWGAMPCLELMLGKKRMFVSHPNLLEAMRWAIKGKSIASLQHILWRLDISEDQAKSQMEKAITDLTQDNELNMLRVIYNSPDFKAKFGFLALEEACRMGNAKCVQLLLDMNILECIKPRRPQTSYTILQRSRMRATMGALDDEFDDIADLIHSVRAHSSSSSSSESDSGTDDDSDETKKEKTTKGTFKEKDVLLLALKSGNFECVDILLKYALKKMTTTNMQNMQEVLNELQIEAMQEETLECVRQFLAFRSLDEGLHLGEHLLQRAFKMRNMDEIEKILYFWSKRLNIDVEDDLGMTLLMHAVGLGLNEMVKQLLLFGANPMKVNRKGLSAFEISHYQDKIECYATMKRHLEVEVLKNSMGQGKKCFCLVFTSCE